MTIDALMWRAQVPLVDFVSTFSTETKVKKIAIATFGSLSSLLALRIFTISLSCAFFSLPLFGLSFLFFKVHGRIKEYEDPLAVQTMKKEAKNLSFSDLIREHQGIEPLLFHKIIDPSDLSLKFQLEMEGKSLSEILPTTSLSYITKHNLMTKEHLRELFYEELCKKNSVSDLYNSLGDIGLDELKRFDVISLSEYERFGALQIQEEEVDFLHRSNLLQLSTLHFGRREMILSELERREKSCKEELQRAHSQKKPASPSFIRDLQMQMKGVSLERARVQDDPSLGLDLQIQYDKAQRELHFQYERKKEKVQEEFLALKARFS